MPEINFASIFLLVSSGIAFPRDMRLRSCILWQYESVPVERTAVQNSFVVPRVMGEEKMFLSILASEVKQWWTKRKTRINWSVVARRRFMQILSHLVLFPKSIEKNCTLLNHGNLISGKHPTSEVNHWKSLCQPETGNNRHCSCEQQLWWMTSHSLFLFVHVYFRKNSAEVCEFSGEKISVHPARKMAPNRPHAILCHPSSHSHTFCSETAISENQVYCKVPAGILWSHNNPERMWFEVMTLFLLSCGLLLVSLKCQRS